MPTYATVKHTMRDLLLAARAVVWELGPLLFPLLAVSLLALVWAFLLWLSPMNIYWELL